MSMEILREESEGDGVVIADDWGSLRAHANPHTELRNKCLFRAHANPDSELRESAAAETDRERQKSEQRGSPSHRSGCHVSYNVRIFSVTLQLRGPVAFIILLTFLFRLKGPDVV
jgi:hypothetical protein